MATIFVSPGVYTSESELSFVAQSVGVTTLGIPGETLKGPAFEPIFVTKYDENLEAGLNKNIQKKNNDEYFRF
jgi:hypothetical protein